MQLDGVSRPKLASPSWQRNGEASVAGVIETSQIRAGSRCPKKRTRYRRHSTASPRARFGPVPVVIPERWVPLARLRAMSGARTYRPVSGVYLSLTRTNYRRRLASDFGETQL